MNLLSRILRPVNRIKQTLAARKQYELLEVGTEAPGFRLGRLGSGEVSLAELTARGPVLLAFFKVTCPVCQLTFPFLERLHSSGKLAVFGISQNCTDDSTAFNREFGITFPTLLDTEKSGFPVSNDYGISHVPTMYLVGMDGRIERVIEGWSKQEIEALGSTIGVRVIGPEDNVPAWKSG